MRQRFPTWQHSIQVQHHGPENHDLLHQKITKWARTYLWNLRFSQLVQRYVDVCLVKVFPENHPEKAVKMYAILDDQSNRSLAIFRSEFFNLFGITECNIAYTLKTCAGTVETEGRQAWGFHVESFDRSLVLPLPVLLEVERNSRQSLWNPHSRRG